MTVSTTLSVKQAAEYLGLAASAVYSLANSKQIACYRIGPNKGRLRFKASDLDLYLERCREGPRERTPVVPQRERYVPKYPL
jgi:excisionase family DNA binding protein